MLFMKKLTYAQYIILMLAKNKGNEGIAFQDHLEDGDYSDYYDDSDYSDDSN